MKAQPGNKIGFVLGGLGCLGIATWLIAHEGHALLPSKGAKVDLDKGWIFLSPEARTALDVGVGEVVMGGRPETILAYATLVSPWKNHAFAVSPLPGRIVSIHARPGQHVEKGDLLAEVESLDSELLRLEIRNAIAEQKLASQVLDGLKESAGAVTQASLLAAESQSKQARDVLELAKAKWLALGYAKETLEDLLSGKKTAPATLPIKSLISGTVLHADISVGRVVEPGEHLFELVDLATVWARIGVLEKDIPRTRVGQPVVLRLTAYPGESFAATIKVVGEMLDPVTHLNDVWVELANPSVGSARLLPGMTGEARIEIPPVSGAKILPATALVHNGVDRFVLVEEANAKTGAEYRKKSLEVLRETPDWVEVRSPDLFPGDKVVERGGHQLGAFFSPGSLKIGPEFAKSIGLAWGLAGPATIDDVVAVSGAVDVPAQARGAVSTRLPGVLLAIDATPGQRVLAGDPLGEMFSLDFLNLQLDLLREALAARLAGEQLTLLKSATDAVSKRRLVEAETAFTQAANRKESLARRLSVVGLSPRDLEILEKEGRIQPTLMVRSPMNGTVVRFDRVVGQSLRIDESILEIHDLSQPLIQGFVPEKDFSRIRIGQHARIRLVGAEATAGDGEIMAAKVVRTGNAFGVTDRVLSVWLEPASIGKATLRHNQMAAISLVVDQRPVANAVPLSAVLREGSRQFVFVQSGETIERRLVRVGLTDDRFAQILDGVEPGTTVAIAAVEALQTAYASVR